MLSGILQVAQGYVEQDSHAWTLAEKLIRELCAAATADGYPFDAEEQIARIRLPPAKGRLTASPASTPT